MISAGATSKRFGILVAGLLGVTGAFAFACSSSSNDVPGGGKPDSSNGLTDADVPADATPDEASFDGGDSGSDGRFGAIFAISNTTVADGGAVQGAHRAGAYFARPISPDQTTTKKTVGPCVVETIGDGDQGKDKQASAGAVHIEGGKKALSLAPKGDGSYALVTGTDTLWNGGETLTVRADGKEVPAFMTTLTAPSKVTLTSPAIPGGALTVNRSAGLSATFTGASSGMVVLYFDAAEQTRAHAATCLFKVSDGAAQIPPAVFADFPAVEGSFNFYVKESAVTNATGWHVTFTASSGMVNGAGAALQGFATFQ